MTVACLKRMVESGHIRRDEETVAFITGGGLKTIEAVQGALQEPFRVPANSDVFVEALEARRAAQGGVAVAAGGA